MYEKILQTEFKGVQIHIKIPKGKSAPLDHIPEWAQFVWNGCHYTPKRIEIESFNGSDFDRVNIITYYPGQTHPLIIKGYMTWGTKKNQNVKRHTPEILRLGSHQV